MSSKENTSTCALCGRQVENLTRHHLIPRTRHKSRQNKKRFSRMEVKERIALLCRPCHKNIHAVLSEKELESQYNTLEELQAHPDIRKFTNWIRRQPANRSIRVRRKIRNI